MRLFGREAFMTGPDGNNSFWQKVNKELVNIGHKVSSGALHHTW